MIRSKLFLLFGITLCIFTTSCNSRTRRQYLIAVNIQQGGIMYFAESKLGAVGVDGLGKVNYDFPKELGYQPDWSPDGKWIVTSIGGRGAGRNADLLFVGLDGNYRYQLITSEEDESDPAWSPDGQTIVYSSGLHSSIINVTCILNKEECQPSPVRIAEGIRPAWSPDSKSIAFDYRGDVFVVHIDKSDKPIQINPEEKHCSEPQWSPDGQSIVASCDNDISLLSPDRNSIKSLGVNGREASWSPDGKAIVFVSTEGDGLGQMITAEACETSALFIINVDGSDRQRLTHGKNECILEYTWLPSINNSK